MEDGLPSSKIKEDDETSSSESIFTKEAIRELIFSIFFGMILPSTDSGTDIRLGVRLITHGHPKWGAAILTPVLMNTIFTIFSCRELERKRAKERWIIYLPLVLLQLYPQFCICRLIYRLLRKKISLKRFILERDGLEGGLGCVEPYCESVPQVFIQTAIFGFVHNIRPLLMRLSYTEKNISCIQHDTCGDILDCTINLNSTHGGCDGTESDALIGSYSMYHRINYCKTSKENCIQNFTQCIQPFKECIQTRADTLYTFIMKLNEEDFYKAETH